MQTITRKFLVRSLPDLAGKERWIQNRFYLYRKNVVVIRIQSSANLFELERKVSKSSLLRESEKIQITKKEFDALSKIAKDTISRDGYLLMEAPHMVLWMYHGRFEGLVRVEIKFGSVEEANRFTPPQWTGKEITNSALGKDETLLDLTNQDFQALL